MAHLEAEQNSFLRTVAAGLRRLQPSLRPEDVLGLVVVVVRPLFERELLTRSKPLDHAELAQIEALCVSCVLTACSDLAVEAGVLSCVALPRSALQERIVRWWHAWRTELALAIEVARRNEWSAPLNPRHCAMFQVWRATCESAPPSADALLQDMRSGIRLARNGRPEQEDLHSCAVAAEYHLLNSEDGRGANLLFVDRNGSARIGKKQVRDVLRDRGQREICETDAKKLEPSDDLERQEAIDLVDDRELVPPAAAEEAESAEAVRAAIAARQVRASRGPAHSAVQEHLLELLAGELGVSELARHRGVSKSSISTALAAERGGLERDLRMRGVG